MCLTNSRGFRARLHNGAWIWKFFVLTGIGVGVFAIPEERISHFKIGIELQAIFHSLSNHRILLKKGVVQTGSAFVYEERMTSNAAFFPPYCSVDVRCPDGSGGFYPNPTLAPGLFRPFLEQ